MANNVVKLFEYIFGIKTMNYILSIEINIDCMSINTNDPDLYYVTA